MKRVEVLVTDSGVPLTNKDDGIVLYGSLFKGDGEAGIANPMHEGAAYTNLEFLDMLDIPLEDVERHVARRKGQIREQGSYWRG